MNNIEVFKDTLNRIRTDERLQRLTQRAAEGTCVIEEGFLSDKKPHCADASVTFEENLTLIPAFRFVDAGKKTAVLNFANPFEPGGGVLRGANAQEEYLCRASGLYPCLTDERAAAYYQYHITLMKMNQSSSMFLGSDMIIYAPEVPFIKEDRGYNPRSSCRPTQEYTDQWRFLDVITCAAPYFSNSQCVLPAGDLYHLFRRRIRNILEAAIDHDIRALVLGAFGCGAFSNPPAVVAKAFQDALLEKRYLHTFSDVVFAVKRTGNVCKNIEAFDAAFQNFPPTGQ